jgi:hypothetical protein
MRPEAWERIALALPYQMTTLGLFNAIAGASMTAKEVIQAQTNCTAGRWSCGMGYDATDVADQDFADCGT